MIEAFEIGVSLALRDGVSDSIAQARRNVEALQKAVDANGLSVRALRDAGARAVSLVSVQPRQETGPRKAEPRVARSDTADIATPRDDFHRSLQADRAEAPARREPERIEIARVIEREPMEAPGGTVASAPLSVRPVPHDEPDVERADVLPLTFSRESAAPQNIEFSAPRYELGEVVPQLQTGAPMAQPGEQVLPAVSAVEQPAPASPDLQPVAAPEREKAAPPAQPQAVAPPSHVFQTLALAQSSSATLELGTLQETGTDDRAPAAPDRVETTPRGFSAEVEAAPRPADSARLDGPGLVKPAAPDIYREERPEPDPILLRDQETDEPGARTFWYSSSTRQHTVVGTPLPQPDPAPQSVAPQARGNAQEPLHGDVYLDGVLVGRWMSRFLKREVERADSGPTGFDAKRGRLLPGVTVGG